jgi:hypothetical protein
MGEHATRHVGSGGGDDLPDVDLELIGTTVLDSRLLAVEYRPDG